MAIRLFIFLLLIISSIVLTITTIIKKQTTTQNIIEKPIITFINSTLYDMNTKEVLQIIQSKKALHYKTKDELEDATIILRSTNNKNKITDTITGQSILKKKNQLTFQGDVIFNRNNEIILNTPFLHYNIKTQIAKNQHKFKLDYLDSILVGNMLYFDGINDIIKADYIKFKLQMKEK